MFFLKELPTREILETYGRRYPAMDVPCIEKALTMLRSASSLLRKLESYFAGHGLSQTRFLLLIVIDREPDTSALTASELGQRLDVSKPVISNTLKSLVSDGLVQSAPHQGDNRSKLFSLTPAGKKRLDAVLPGYYGVIQEHMECSASNEEI